MNNNQEQQNPANHIDSDLQSTDNSQNYNSNNNIDKNISSNRVRDVIFTLAPLAWVAFGGPQAHLALLHEQVIDRRKWLDSKTFTELFALCSILPGPTALQTVIGLGIIHAGILGGICSLVVWTFPAVAIMIGLAVTARYFDPDTLNSILVGVRPAAVGLIAVAAWKLGKLVVNDTFTFLMLGLGAVICILYPTPLTFPTVLLSAALLALVFTKYANPQPEDGNDNYTVNEVSVNITKIQGTAALILFLVLLIALTVSMSVLRTQRETTASTNENYNYSEPIVMLSVAECFYRNSSLIFGGGQVLLPLLQTDCVEVNHWVTPEQFGNGLGIMQSAPGPLFSFSGYIGAMLPLTNNNGETATVIKQIGYGLLAVTAIFLPAFLLLVGILPYWASMRKWSKIRCALIGVNACAVGLVVAAIWLLGKDYVKSPVDFAIVMLAFGLIIKFKVPAPMVIIVSGIAGAAATRLFLR